VASGLIIEKVRSIAMGQFLVTREKWAVFTRPKARKQGGRANFTPLSQSRQVIRSPGIRETATSSANFIDAISPICSILF